MRLDRNKGHGKYAIINLRKVDGYKPLGGMPTVEAVASAIAMLGKAGLINYGEPGTENEFFVVMLKDLCADFALRGYANAAAEMMKDREYATDVMNLAKRAGTASQFCKVPD